VDSTSEQIEDYGLLPHDKTFSQLFLPFALPYFAYVGLGVIPHSLVSIEILGMLRFLFVAVLIWFYRKQYRFGPRLTSRQIGIALVAGMVATFIWVLTLRFSLALPFWRNHLVESPLTVLTPFQWFLRAASSTLLVPIFEELFCRAYFGAFLNRVPEGKGSFSSRLALKLDYYPEPMLGPPLSKLSILGTTLIFTLGHDLSSWMAAILYFLFTTWVYAKTRSFRICILMHGIANFSIALLVLLWPVMHFLW
jgi:uncharacterized protein